MSIARLDNKIPPSSLGAAPSLPDLLAAKDHPVWLQVGTLLDGCSTAPLRDAHLVYDATAIRYVGDANNPPPADLVKTDQRTPDCILPNHTVFPGLIESHAHLFLEGGELNLEKRQIYLKKSPAELLALAKERLEKLVRLGVMAVRDAGDKDGVGLALAKLYMSPDRFCLSLSEGEKVEERIPRMNPRTSASSTIGRQFSLSPSEGERAGVRGPSSLHHSITPSLHRPVMPYLDSPGAAIHHKGRYGSFMAEPTENFPSLHAAVEARVKAGAYRIKLIPTGIINFKKGAVTTPPQMTVEEVAQIVQAAKSFGKQTFAHASGADGIEVALEGGVDSIEHGFFIRDDQLAKMRDRQIAWVPTFAPVQEQVDHAAEMGWDDTIKSNLQRILDQHAASLRKAHEMGVQIIAGSDAGSCGVAHGYGLLNELELMEKAGLPSISAINAATGTPSRRLGFHEKIGQIANGYKTRLILTEHSPIHAINNLQSSRTSIFDGTLYPSPQTILKGL
jgi:imidazolonepropionase-like amidohydrolase